MYPRKQLAQLVIATCNEFHLDTVVISPGSRNAPLTVGFANHPEITTYSIVDERCAAFFAMGIAQQQQKPVAVLCTSGSALLNYYPAVAEAFYSKIPLVVISADRPKYLIDRGDGQTIRQENVFANHILFSANLVEEESLGFNAGLLHHAFQKAIANQGPIHINVPFDEPLYETTDAIGQEVLEAVVVRGEQSEDRENMEVNYGRLSKIWNSAKRKLILVGVHSPSESLQAILHRYAEDPSVLIFTETTSNVYHPDFIHKIDQLITPLDEEGFQQLQPEVLVTLGGLIVSKRIKQFLRKYQPKHHWHVDKVRKLDTYFCLSEFITLEPSTFLTNLGKTIYAGSFGYKQYGVGLKQKRNIAHRRFVEDLEYSDFKVFAILLASLPKKAQLQLSNSSVIRYTQLFTLDPSLQVFCNRGTSGIDGSTSTAIGAALGNKNQTVFITGDISFYYDSNALWNRYVPNNFRIIILNNSGGGIFKIIPGPKSTNALDYFETPHQLTAEHLAKTYGFTYCSAINEEELTDRLGNFYEDSEKPVILEVFTPSALNDSILKQYFKSL